jgi:hypothetical protein
MVIMKTVLLRFTVLRIISTTRKYNYKLTVEFRKFCHKCQIHLVK